MARNALGEIDALFKLELAEALRASTAEQIKLAGKGFGEIVKLYQEILKNQNGLRKVNQELADSMQQATLEAYNERVVRHQVASYRDGDGRFPGALRDALEDPSMAVGTATGIAFINETLLNDRAIFWARLNFGTLGTGEQSFDFPAPRARLQFGSNQGINLHLAGDRRPPFRVPEFPKHGGDNKGLGYFNPEGQFFLGKGNKEEGDKTIARSGFSRGIGARRFLDAGLVRLARDFKPFYQRYVDSVTRQVQSRINS